MHIFWTRTKGWQLFICSFSKCLHFRCWWLLKVTFFFFYFILLKNSMLKITTCTHWITCTGVLRKCGMVSLVGMLVNWRRLWEDICLTFLKNNQTCFISWWVKVPALCYKVVWCLEYLAWGSLVHLFGHMRL